ncbi:melanization protease 1-like [Drosophila sulfurigaster albostrigata]|uniref:melanization protease 1-like n=1 Tax=Drosophila sulfurigaster albostrigata TaxID=89887 RepID=UPI002D2192DF|nr:melanization protease 1-like [Drosophila sulfurigaster albostrigata]
MVANGKKVEPHSIPFIASLQRRKKSDLSWEWICGGALIDTKFILTAAHCVDGFDKNINEMSVLLGAHNKTEINNTTRFNVKNITIHPNYTNVTRTLNDIAILEMEGSADFSTFKIRPACLPTSSREDIKEFRSAGFGRTKEGKESSELLQTTLTTRDIKKCQFTTYTNLNETLNFCTGPKNGKTGGDVCRGDSGGPIFTFDPNHSNCLFAVMGVISKGNSCGANGSSTLHTRVSYYREWIEQIVWPNDIVNNNI